jgi:hypothetical protein
MLRRSLPNALVFTRHEVTDIKNRIEPVWTDSMRDQERSGEDVVLVGAIATT